jgi:5-methylcytosine-specific restriction endonuclease McrA
MSKKPRVHMLRPSIATLGDRLGTVGGTRRVTGAAGNTTARGYGWRWQQVRERVLQRDHGLCQACLENGHTTAATDVDHVIPKVLGGSDDESNLRSLCRGCHEAKTRAENEQQGRAE